MKGHNIGGRKMVYGYIRNAIGQKYKQQVQILEEHGCEKLYKNGDFNELLKKLREGDKLVISNYSTLDYNVSGYIKLIANFHRNNIALEVLNEGFNSDHQDGKNIYNFCNSIVQVENAIRSETAKKNIETYDIRGVKNGRKRVDLKKIERAFELYEKNVRMDTIVELTGVSKSTFYKYKKEAEADK